MTTSQRLTVYVVAGVTLTVLLLTCWPEPHAPVPADIVKTADSLAIVKPIVDSALVASQRKRDSIARELRSARAKEQASADLAEQLRVRGDSLEARAFRERSNVMFWRQALQTRDQENGELRFQLTQAHAQVALLVQDTVNLRKDLKDVVDLNHALDDFNLRLRRDLAKKGDGCQVLWMDCPSRKHVVAGILILEGAAAAVIAIARP